MTGEPTPRVLVPVEVLADAPAPGATAEMVSAVDVVVLGYHVVPHQTPPGQMRMQYGEEAQADVDAFAEAFRERGGEVETRLVFTADAQQTFTRVSNEETCTAILLPRPSERMERLLVPARGEANLSRLVHVTARLLRGTEMTATLFHVAEDEDDAEAAELMLRGVRERLAEEGIDPDRVPLTVGVAEAPLDALVEAAGGFDGLVLGETEPSLADVVFGPAHERVAADYGGPILVVRRTHQGDVPVPDEEV